MKFIGFLCITIVVLLRSASADPVGTCPSEMNSQTIVFLADSKDCSTYYKCNWGEPMKYVCYDGLHFNKEIGVCDWPENAGCNVSDNESEESIEEQENLASEEEESNEKESSEEKCPNDCPSVNGELPVYFAHPEDCGKFCQCDNGIAYDMTCSEGLHFNIELNICDFPINAGCEIDNSIDDGSGEPDSHELNLFGYKNEENIDVGSGDVESESSENSEDESKETPEVEESGCPDDVCPEQNGILPVFFAHPDKCEKYCVCDWGKAYDMECPAGLHFNLELNVCDYPENAGCQ